MTKDKKLARDVLYSLLQKVNVKIEDLDELTLHEFKAMSDYDQGMCMGRYEAINSVSEEIKRLISDFDLFDSDGIIPKLPEPPEPDIIYEGFFTTKIVNKPPLAQRLKSAFKKVNYAPVQGAQCKANLYNQFSESALDEIISQLIQLGITIKEGD